MSIIFLFILFIRKLLITARMLPFGHFQSKKHFFFIINKMKKVAFRCAYKAKSSHT
jgi:hypothetical protein